MKPRAVFLDSGIFVAFMDRSDVYHAPAVDLFGAPPRRWYTSFAVVSESYGWFLHRMGEQAARQFRELLGMLPSLQWLPLDATHHAAVVRKLDRHRGRKLTYVDASSLVWLERRRIAEVWGTDTDLAIEGARVRPRLA
jgi:predicted nucleic acid-binding protein